jgi:hypothetical protein
MAAVTALSAVGIALGGTAAQAHPASYSKCPGSYTAKVKATEKGFPPKWDSKVNAVSEQGTTCKNGHAVAGAFARVNCGACKAHDSIDGYKFKTIPTDNLEYAVTAKHGAVTVKFMWYTNPS